VFFFIFLQSCTPLILQYDFSNHTHSTDIQPHAGYKQFLKGTTIRLTATRTNERRLEMKKSFKTFAVAITAFSTISIGTAFANTNTAEKLSSWYEEVYQKTTKQIQTSLKDYAVSLLPSLEAEQERLTQETTEDIEKFANITFLKKFSQITVHSSNYLEQLWNKTDFLTGEGEYASNGSQVSKDFDTFVSNTNTEVNNYINDQAENFIEEVTNELDGVVDDSVSSMENTKTGAIQALETRINNSKEELNVLIAAEKDASTDSMKANLDQQISNKKAEIINETEKLESVLKGQITSTGTAIEQNAKNEMNSVISSIN
jgi:hypothetical protein